MFQISKKINWMLILWGILILAGTALTIYGSAKFNDEWNKKSSIRQLHTIPDFLLIDFEVKAKLDSNITKQILSEVKPKIHIPGDSIENQEKIPLTGFFDEGLFQYNTIAKINYKLSDNIYEEIRNFNILGQAISKDKSVSIGLRKNNSQIIFTSQRKNYREPFIEVRSYNQKNDEFEIFYKNILLNVEFNKQSKFITDLDKGELEFSIITKPKIKELKNVRIKTKSAEYFSAIDIEKEDFQYKAKLNLLLR